MDDRQSAIGIETANRTLSREFSRQDIDALLDGFYAPDALVSGGSFLETTKDRAKIHAFFSELRAGAFDRIDLESEHIDDHGDWAVEVGKGFLRQGDAPPAAAIRFMVVWKNTERGWRAVADFFAPAEGSN